MYDDNTMCVKAECVGEIYVGYKWLFDMYMLIAYHYKLTCITVYIYR